MILSRTAKMIRVAIAATKDDRRPGERLFFKSVLPYGARGVVPQVEEDLDSSPLCAAIFRNERAQVPGLSGSGVEGHRVSVAGD